MESIIMNSDENNSETGIRSSKFSDSANILINNKKRDRNHFEYNNNGVGIIDKNSNNNDNDNSKPVINNNNTDKNNNIGDNSQVEVKRKTRAVKYIIESRKFWKVEEDNELKKIVEEHGTKDWGKIASKMSTTRTGHQCSRRWSQYLKPGAAFANQCDLRSGSHRQQWTPEEDNLLIKLVKECNDTVIDWKSISDQMLTNRNGIQCNNRWKLLESEKNTTTSTSISSNTDSVKPLGLNNTTIVIASSDLTNYTPTLLPPPPPSTKRWTKEEDMELLNLVKENDRINDWFYIAEKMSTNRTFKQCSHRWNTHLKFIPNSPLNSLSTSNSAPNSTQPQSTSTLSNSTSSNSNLILASTSLTPTELSIFHDIKETYNQRWTPEEDSQLKKLVEEQECSNNSYFNENNLSFARYSHLNWIKISSQMLTRNSIQCKYRWALLCKPNSDSSKKKQKSLPENENNINNNSNNNSNNNNNNSNNDNKNYHNNNNNYKSL